MFKDKVVLVTGGTGTIGREIVRQLLAFSPKVIRVFSRDEHKQLYLKLKFQKEVEERRLRFLVGDVRDLGRLKFAVEGVDIIFHAAALKHVPACEYNPFEAVKTNVIGTQNLIEAALLAGVELVVGISTDKAVSPINTMGATKLLAEKLLLAANNYKGSRKTRFCVVRFGNIIGSRGSVVPLVLTQLARGEPITVTDPDMVRYFTTAEYAVRKLIEASMKAKGGEIFVLKMPRIRLGDLIGVLIEEFASLFGRSPKDVPVRVLGPRPGEKKEERLLSEEEMTVAHDLGDMFVVYSFETYKNGEGLRQEDVEGKLLDKGEIRELLRQAGITREKIGGDLLFDLWI